MFDSFAIDFKVKEPQSAWQTPGFEKHFAKSLYIDIGSNNIINQNQGLDGLSLVVAGQIDQVLGGNWIK